MTEDEKRINNIDSRVSNLETKFEVYIQRQNEMATDIRELRQDMKDMQKASYAKMDNMDGKIDGIGKHVQNISVAANAAVGGMFVAVGVMVGTMIYSILSR